MTELYPNLCYNEVCYKGPALCMFSCTPLCSSSCYYWVVSFKKIAESILTAKRENLLLLNVKNECADQPVHVHWLVSTFVAHCLECITDVHA